MYRPPQNCVKPENYILLLIQRTVSPGCAVKGVGGWRLKWTSGMLGILGPMTLTGPSRVGVGGLRGSWNSVGVRSA